MLKKLLKKLVCAFCHFIRLSSKNRCGDCVCVVHSRKNTTNLTEEPASKKKTAKKKTSSKKKTAKKKTSSKKK